MRRSGTKKKKKRKEKKTKDEIRDELFGLMMFQEKDSEVQVKKFFWNPGTGWECLDFSSQAAKTFDPCLGEAGPSA